MAKSKIKSIKIYDKTNKDGSKSCGITFEDNVFGFYGFKGELELKQGDEVEYSYTEHDNKSKPGEKYKKLTISEPTKETPTPAKAEQKPPTSNNPALIPLKATASIKAMEFVVNAFIADKINYDKIPEYYKELKGYLFDALDEIGS